MDPSKFPTDNLYKFMALCGMVLIAACGYAHWQLNDRASTYQWEEALHEYNVKMLLRRYNEEQNKEVKDIFFKMFSAENARGAHPNNHEAGDQKFMAQLDGNLTALKVGMGIGVVLTAFGFFFWYTKLQRHLDKMVSDGMKPS